MPRQLIIGDIHGHYGGLQVLWRLIAPTAADQVYFVGDLIDRGPRSAEVVEFVRHHAAGCVRGNHEQLLIDAMGSGEEDGTRLSALEGWLYSGGQATLNSYEAHPHLLEEHLDWIRKLPSYLDLGNLWLVHAGVNPALPLSQQTPHDMCWIREVFHRSPQPYFPNKLIITGHTITFTFPSIAPGQVVEGKGWLDIDTGVYHPRSGWLTALDWDNQMVYQVNVFTTQQRVRPYAEAVTYLDPSLVRSRSRGLPGRLSRISH
ncbi:serine/threonine protein phosphatase [Leptolyngbya sp. BL0902]|uniref:metallophosphoesterase family protein n=1 Tax=Leptolyngbya sp. BL0902 TaxID=1115757 RepID=UPI0018E89A01|nr:metallophosphoesterase family protein [Leptolyngbya sp. BL0902]QQE65404.1 serine/threonine protein phosphatase [Leptolyngbya sp. BL0902]